MSAADLCVECGAPVGEVEPYCGASICPHGDCSHNHHDGCPSCWHELAQQSARDEEARTRDAMVPTAYELEVSEP